MNVNTDIDIQALKTFKKTRFGGWGGQARYPMPGILTLKRLKQDNTFGASLGYAVSAGSD